MATFLERQTLSAASRGLAYSSMNILLPILIASTPVTTDFPCWEVRDGQVIDLTFLCPVIEVPPEVNEAAFIAELEENITSSVILSRLDELDPVGTAQQYCEDRQSGISDEVWVESFQFGVEAAASQDNLAEAETANITDGLAEYAAAISTYSPEYFCPEVN